VLDADIRGFFDTLDHGWLVKFIEHRVADRRVVRLIQKWLSAGVLEDGKRTRSEVGTVQGGSVSPLLANVYLHYVFDLWVRRWRRSTRRATWSSCVLPMTLPWDSSIGRKPSASWPSYASDSRSSAWSCTPTRRGDRVRPFRRLEPAPAWRGQAGDLQLPGLHAHLREDAGGKFTVLRQTMQKRWRVKLEAVKADFRQRLHDSRSGAGRLLALGRDGSHPVLRRALERPGPEGVPWRHRWIWCRTLRRRSQRHRLT